MCEKLYICDGTACGKQCENGCYMFGGECYHTKKPEHALFDKFPYNRILSETQFLTTVFHDGVEEMSINNPIEEMKQKDLLLRLRLIMGV